MKGIFIYLLLLAYALTIDSIDEPELKASNKILCTGGKVVGKRCVCPAGKEYFAGYCRKYERPECVGGRIVNGRCKCPKKKIPISGRCISLTRNK